MSRRRDTWALANARAPASIFAALGDRRRLQLIQRLSCGEPCSISELSRDSHVTRQAITKHLRVLENAGLVRGARLGRETRFTFAPRQIDDAREYLSEVSRHWSDALKRLKVFVETDAERPPNKKPKD